MPPPPQPAQPFAGPVWNVWAERNLDGSPKYTPTNLRPGQSGLVILDLSAFAYELFEVATSYKPASTSLKRWLDAPERRNDAVAQLRVLAIPDERFFEPLASTEKIQTMTIDLVKLRQVQQDGLTQNMPDSVLKPFEILRAGNGKAPFSFVGDKRAVFPIQVKKAANTGRAAIALSFWTIDGTPVDEVSFTACVLAKQTDSCAKTTVTGGDSLQGVDIADHASYPDAALHVLQLDSDHLVGVFRCNTCGWDVSDFKTWTINRGPSDFRRYFLNTILPSVKVASTGSNDSSTVSTVAPSESEDPVAALDAQEDSAKAYDPHLLEQAGDALYGLIFPSEDASDAKVAFRQFVASKLASQKAGASAPSLFVRLLVQPEDQSFIIPAGLMRVPVDDGREFIGFKFRVQTPLELQDYSETASCLSKWVLLVPPKDLGGNPLTQARQQFVNWISNFQSATQKATVYDNIDEFESGWLNPQGPTNPENDVIVILSHHENNALFFDPQKSKIYSTGIGRTFNNPSVVILGACATANPGAFDFVREFNAHGVETIVASSVDTDAKMGGSFLNVLADTLQKHAGNSSYTFDTAFFDAITTLAAEQDGYSPPQAWGSRVLIFALIGNGNVRLCTP